MKTRRSSSMEILERRQLFSVFVVSNTADSGVGSLRQNLEDINADASSTTDELRFEIGTGGAATIKLQSLLPAVQHSIDIDGMTQPGYSGNPLITIDFPSTASDLTLDSTNSSVQGLNFVGGFTGLTVKASDAVVFNNTFQSVGGSSLVIDQSSSDAITVNTITGSELGIYLEGASTGNGINDNTITGVSGAGLTLGENADKNTVANNQVTNGGSYGMLVSSNSNLVQGNTVGANASTGIEVLGSKNTITANNVTGNEMGVDYNGADGGTGNATTKNVIEYNKTGGVDFENASGDTLVGNTVALNLGVGVIVDGGHHDELSQNSIFSNSLTGISLIDGGNDGLAAPTINESLYAPTFTELTGTLHAVKNTKYLLEFYGNTDGSKQGTQYLGDLLVTTNSKGAVTYTTKLSAITKADETITATANTGNGDSSAFSTAVVGKA